MAFLKFKLQYLWKTRKFMTICVLPIIICFSLFYYVSISKSESLEMVNASQIVYKQLEDYHANDNELAQHINTIYNAERDLLLAKQFKNSSNYLTAYQRLYEALQNSYTHIPNNLQPYFFKPQKVYQEYLKLTYKAEQNIPLFQNDFNVDTYIFLVSFLLEWGVILFIYLLYTGQSCLFNQQHKHILNPLPLSPQTLALLNFWHSNFYFFILPTLALCLSLLGIACITNSPLHLSPVLVNIGHNTTVIPFILFFITNSVKIMLWTIVCYFSSKKLITYIQDNLIVSILLFCTYITITLIGHLFILSL